MFVPFDHPHSFSPLQHFFVKCSCLEISFFQNCILLWEVPEWFLPGMGMCVLTGCFAALGLGLHSCDSSQQHVCLWLWPHRLWQLCDDALEWSGHHGWRAAPGQVSAAGPECQRRDPGADKALGDPDQGLEGKYLGHTRCLAQGSYSVDSQMLHEWTLLMQGGVGSLTALNVQGSCPSSALMKIRFLLVKSTVNTENWLF